MRLWRTRVAKRTRHPRGFSLLEMLFATVILLTGLVGIAQLVPTSILLNTTNRWNSSSLVFAQRELDQMLTQPLTSTAFLDAQGNACNLGDPAQPGVIVGNAVLVGNGRPLIDFSPSAAVIGYSFQYTDPNDPGGTSYDVRWAVITQVQGSTVIAKRFILGVSRSGGSGFVPPVTLDAAVTK